MHLRVLLVSPPLSLITEGPHSCTLMAFAEAVEWNGARPDVEYDGRMAYQIDFLTVGDPGEDGKCCKSGDAIALRYGNLCGPRGEQTVMIVDGGFTSAGEALVKHVKEHYGTDVVDFVVSSHPHDDHIQGLFPVVESLKVCTLLMHKPWDHAHGVLEFTNDDRTTLTGTRRRLRESFAAARNLNALATRKGVNVLEPFQGAHTEGNVVLFLGPSVDFYRKCIAADLAGLPMEGAPRSLASLLIGAAQAVVRAAQETWDSERLTEPASDAVEPLNHTSTIIHLNFGDKILLTGDAGVQALTLAADYADSRSIDLRTCTRIQVPHHGSKRNVGPSILNRIVGPIRPAGDAGSKAGMLSCAKDGEPKHPSTRVTNAFFRRGAPCSGTRGRHILWSSQDAPARPGWSIVPCIPFRDQYNEEED